MLSALCIALVWLAAVLGWVMNFVYFVGMLGGPMSTMFVGRVVGIFIAPLGAILGYF